MISRRYYERLGMNATLSGLKLLIPRWQNWNCNTCQKGNLPFFDRIKTVDHFQYEHWQKKRWRVESPHLFSRQKVIFFALTTWSDTDQNEKIRSVITWLNFDSLVEVSLPKTMNRLTDFLDSLYFQLRNHAAMKCSWICSLWVG